MVPASRCKVGLSFNFCSQEEGAIITNSNPFAVPQSLKPINCLPNKPSDLFLSRGKEESAKRRCQHLLGKNWYIIN